MEARDTIREPDVRSSPLPPDPLASWARYARINITQDQLVHQTAARKQSFDVRLYRLDIERVRLDNNRRFRTAFVANQKRAFQVLSTFLYDYLGFTKCLEVCFVDVLAN